MVSGMFFPRLAAVICIISLTVFPAAAAADITVGALVDLSGPTADSGRDYALGMVEAVHWVNEHGGVNGKFIKLFQFDYGYRKAEAIAKYRMLRRYGCAAILGWGSDDSDALSAEVNRDQIPYLSAFYPARFADPRKYPFNLSAGTDLSTQARAAITAWFDLKWPHHRDFGKRKPRLVCAYMASSPFGRAPVKALKDQARLLGFEVGPDQDILLYAVEAKKEVMAMRRFNADVVWHGNTAKSVAATLTDAARMGLEADHLVNAGAFDHSLVKIAGAASEGIMGVAAGAFPGETVPRMADVLACAARYHPGTPVEKRSVRTIQAWMNVLLLREALKRAERAGDLSGRAILKNGFETLRGFETGLGAPAVSLTQDDHRSAAIVPVYEIEKGAFRPLQKVNLAERWPSRWASNWAGW